ncbi:MAG: NAD(P)H-hydrate dehydratase [Candidatus Omnitrophota bacterium]
MNKVDILLSSWNLLFNRPKNSHKGTFGHLFVIAGSAGMTGAASLVCGAALRSGCGMVTVGVPRCLLPIIEIKLTEVIKNPLAETSAKTLSLNSFPEIKRISKHCDAIAVGPGLSQHKETQKLIRKIITELNAPFVIDADALNALEGYTPLIKKIKSPFVLTPHPAEMGRLSKKSVSDIQKNRKEAVRIFIENYDNTVLALKGYGTLVANKKNLYENKTGSSSMATAGTGDVLTGIIGAFLAQGIDAYEAAKIGVCVHGLAGELSAKFKGPISTIAGDLIEYLPFAFKELKANVNVLR